MIPIKIFSNGDILETALYNKVKNLDKVVFYGCGDEFLKNREWWVIVDKKQIVAYCGSIYNQGICIFNRAWVKSEYRGLGLQKILIKTRLNAAKGNNVAISYTTADNYASANNLIDCGFRLYCPEYAYGGRDKLYFKKSLI